MAGLFGGSLYQVWEVRLDILAGVCPGNDIYRLSSPFRLHIKGYNNLVSPAPDGQADRATVGEGVLLNAGTV